MYFTYIEYIYDKSIKNYNNVGVVNCSRAITKSKNQFVSYS